MTSLGVFIGNKIKNFRIANNIKQVELANMINMEPTNLSKIEKGIHFPKDETINKITEALNTDLNTLLAFEYNNDILFNNKKQLIKNINNLLNSSNLKDIQFFYKILSSYNSTFH